MLRTWTKILPFFIIEWYIKNHGKVFSITENGKERKYNAPYPFTRFMKETQ